MPPGPGIPFQRGLPHGSSQLCHCWKVWGGWGSRTPPPCPGQAPGAHTPSRPPPCLSPGTVAPTPSPGRSPGLGASCPAGTTCSCWGWSRPGPAPPRSLSGKPPACSRKSRTRQSIPEAGGSAEGNPLRITALNPLRALPTAQQRGTESRAGSCSSSSSWGMQGSQPTGRLTLRVFAVMV